MDTVSSNNTLVSETTTEMYIDVQTQEISNRTSTRIKKIPVRRTKDFIWYTWTQKGTMIQLVLYLLILWEIRLIRTVVFPLLIRTVREYCHF
jgi:hypothetical protein